jgi:hypothetical protein
MKKVLMLLAFASSVEAYAQVQYLYLDTLCSGNCPGVPPEYTTVQLYAHCTNPSDVISTVYGMQETPLYITTDCCFYQSALGSNSGGSVNCSFCSFFPDACYDSWVTIGCACSAGCGAGFLLQSPGQPWIDEFNETPCPNAIVMDDVIGGAWLVLPDNPSALAGDDLDVLLGQFTVCGSLCATLNIQIFPQYAGPGSPVIQQTGLTVGSGCEVACAQPGCMDAEAANYDPTADCEPIGACVYCNLSVAEVFSTDPLCAYSNNGSLDVDAEGGEGFVHYFLGDNNNLTGAFGGLGNGNYTVLVVDEYFQAGNPGNAILPDGCTLTVEVEIYTPPVVYENALNTPVSCYGDEDGCAEVDISGGTGALDIELKDCNNGLFVGGGNLNLPTGQYCLLEPGAYYWLVTDASGCTYASNCFNIAAPPQLQLAVSQVVGVECPGAGTGSATVSAMGGTGDVDFSFSAGGPFTIESGVFDGVLFAGNYTVFGQDASGCTAQAGFVITSPDPIVNASSTTPTTCLYTQDGCVSFAAAGGNGAEFAFSLNGVEYPEGAVVCGLMHMVYPLAITDAAGCVQSFELAIPGPTAIDLNETVEDVSCQGSEDGAMVLAPSGGAGGPYILTLNGIEQANTLFTDLAPGDYAVQVTDAAGCALDVVIAVNEPEALDALATVSDALCAGDASGVISVDAVGGSAPYTFYLNGGTPQEEPLFEGLSIGSYALEVIDANGCGFSVIATIGEPAPLEPGSIETVCASSSAACDGMASAAISGGTGPYGWQWVDDGGETVSEAAAPDNLCAGSYSVIATDANGCQALFAGGVEICVGIAEPIGGAKAWLSPNPASATSLLNLTGWQGERLVIELRDAAGHLATRQVLKAPADHERLELPVAMLAAGCYHLSITGKHRVVLKLVRE